MWKDKAMRQQTVLELRVDFKYDLEDIRQQAIGRIVKAIKRWTKPALHGRASCTFVLISNETSTELLRRMTATLEEIDSVDNYWCRAAPTVAVARNGLDPYVHWLDAAWKQARKWNEEEDMRKSQVFRRSPKGRI
jgi:hypothetical protein